MRRNKFSLSHYKLLTCKMGKIVPISQIEVLPGDTIQQATSALIRTSAMNAPVMHPVQVQIHHWYVPYRLIWEDFESFITGGEHGDDATVHPWLTVNPAQGELADYLGLPLGTEIEVSALPFRVYQLIYNENYRDQDLQDKIDVSKASGEDTTTGKYIRSANWEKDYFTTCRPEEQKGANVVIPFSDVDVVGNNQSFTFTTDEDPAPKAEMHLVAYEDGHVGVDPVPGAGEGGWMKPHTTEAGLVAKLSNNLIDVADLRMSLALQRYAEIRSKYGSRYSEYLRSLGVISSDARLGRPEYLGGGKQTIQFSEVVQSGPDSTDAGVGSLRGHGIGALRSNRYRKFFEEHGMIMSVMIIRPKTIYAQGIHRMWSRQTKEDYFQKELQDVGAQEVLVKELYAAGGGPESVFGYQDRYDEYRRCESGIAGKFRTTNLDWHFGRIFENQPTLNSSFIQCNATDRVFQETSTDNVYAMVNHSIQARRPLVK